MSGSAHVIVFHFQASTKIAYFLMCLGFILKSAVVEYLLILCTKFVICWIHNICKIYLLVAFLMRLKIILKEEGMKLRLPPIFSSWYVKFIIFIFNWYRIHDLNLWIESKLFIFYYYRGIQDRYVSVISESLSMSSCKTKITTRSKLRHLVFRCALE